MYPFVFFPCIVTQRNLVSPPVPNAHPCSCCSLGCINQDDSIIPIRKTTARIAILPELFLVLTETPKLTLDEPFRFQLHCDNVH
jgi:hypothetical protein